MSTRHPSDRVLPHRRRSALLAAVFTAVAALALVGCGGQQQPTEYGADYEKNFMFGCTGVEANSDGDYVDEKYMSASQCECVYEGLVDKVPFDEVKEFEDYQAGVADGKDIDIPPNMQKIVDDCA